MEFCTIWSPIGFLKLSLEDEKLIEVSFVKEFIKTDNRSKLMQSCCDEFSAYFNKKLKNFSIPCEFKVGTHFQKNVWKAITLIPYGKTISYKELAKIVGNEKASRSIGGANNKNPLPIIVPCHRVIGSNGSLIGYSGGIANKQKLLELEKLYSSP